MNGAPLKLPAIIVNFKCYQEATGRMAVRLAKVAEEVAERYGVSVAVAPQFTDIAVVAREVSVPVFAQHVDPVRPGSHTGHVLPEAVREAGAVGTLLNHSERRLPPAVLRESVARAREAGLVTLVCADTPGACGEAAKLGPDLIAVEPPELIGTGVPVSRARPEVVTKALEAVKKIDPAIPVLCGAGITSGADVEAAVRLGARGVLVASGVVKAEDPRRVLAEMAEALLASKA